MKKFPKILKGNVILLNLKQVGYKMLKLQVDWAFLRLLLAAYLNDKRKS